MSNKSIGGSGFGARRARQDSKGCRQLHSGGFFFYSTEKIVAVSYPIGWKYKRRMLLLLQFIPEADLAIRSFLVPRRHGIPCSRAILQMEHYEVILRIVSRFRALRSGKNRKSEILPRDLFRCRSARRNDLLSPSCDPGHRRIFFGVHRKYSMLFRKTSHECKVISGIRRNRMLKSALSRPLCDSRSKVDNLTSGVPSVVLQFRNGAHWPARQNPPVTFFHIGHLDQLSVNHGRDAAYSD